MRSARYQAFLLTALVFSSGLAAACDDRPSTPPMSPLGPGPMAGPQGSGGGMGPSGGGMGPMSGMRMVVESELDYLKEMIPHHEEAIAAASVLQQGTERAEMRRFARSIIESQTAEVRQMKQWLAAWYPEDDPAVAYEPMMRDLTGLRGNALDQAFLQDMIPHHMMAVMMSQQFLALNLAAHAEVVPFAGNIRDVQRNEIQMMTQWLREWFTSPGVRS